MQSAGRKSGGQWLNVEKSVNDFISNDPYDLPLEWSIYSHHNNRVKSKSVNTSFLIYLPNITADSALDIFIKLL